MPTLEEQIARVADAAFERTAPVAFDPLVRRTTKRPWTSPVGLAAAVLLTAALAGLLAMVWFRDEPEVPAPTATIAPPPAVNEPTVTYPVDEEWLVPAFLPDGMQYWVAQRYGEEDRILTFLDRTTRASLSVGLGRSVRTPDEDAEAVELGGRTWRVEALDPTTTSYIATVDGTPASVFVDGADRAVSDQVVASLAWRQATSLPRPPLDLVERSTVLVATATVDGRPVELRVETDGVMFKLDAGGGSLSELAPGAVLDVGSAQGPGEESLAADGEAESLIYGLARADVSTVVVELTDGRTVSAPTQDLSGRFIENFYLIAVPTRTAAGFELIEAIVALDADGNELLRTDPPF